MVERILRKKAFPRHVWLELKRSHGSTSSPCWGT
jgi:hypothetical protein